MGSTRFHFSRYKLDLYAFLAIQNLKYAHLRVWLIQITSHPIITRGKMAELLLAILTAAMAHVRFIEAELYVLNTISWLGGVMASPSEGFHLLFGV